MNTKPSGSVASVTDQINALYKGDLAECAAQLHDRVMEVCGESGEGDLLSPAKKAIGEQWWQGAVNFLLNPHKWFLPAEALLRALWDSLGERQCTQQAHVDRGMISQYLTELQHQRGEERSAFRWALHTQAEDILSTHGAGGGLGRQWLYGAFGISKKELDRLSGIATKCRENSEKAPDGWASVTAFSEEVVRRLAFDEPVGAALFTRTISESEFHLSRPFLSTQLNRQPIGTDQERGSATEDVASYLFSLLPGCVPRRNVLDSKLTYEFDLVVRNLSPREHLTTHIFGRHFLVECKNWAKAVGTQAVGYFLLRMNLTRTHFGVVFSENGISKGKSGEMAAASLVQRAFHQNGAVCISIDGKDLRSLGSGQIRSVEQLLLDKMELVRFGKAKKRSGN